MIRIFKIIFLIAIADSIVRINIWHGKLKHMCFSKGDSLYQELIDNQKNLSLHLANFHLANVEFSSGMEACQNNATSKLKLENFFDKVQLCMDEQYRLLEDQKNIFVPKLLEVLCQLFMLGGGKIDDQCSSITEKHFSLCRQAFQEFPTILLPLIYNTEECSEARRLLTCFENGVQDCNETTRREFESANNVTYYTLFDCQNIKIDEELPKIDDAIISSTMETTTIEFNDTDDTLGIINESEDIRSIIKNQPMVRFNFTKTDLIEKCQEKGNDFFKDVGNSYKDFLSIKSQKQYLIRNLKDKSELKAVVDDSCYNAPDIKSTLNRMFNTVEQCLEEEDRAEEDSKEILLNKSIDKFCSELDILGSLSTNDHECLHDSSTFYQLASCSRNISAEQFYFENLPLLFISSQEECNNLHENHNCKLNVHDDCENSTKSWLQKQFNEESKFAGCEEAMQEITSDD